MEIWTHSDNITAKKITQEAVLSYLTACFIRSLFCVDVVFMWLQSKTHTVLSLALHKNEGGANLPKVIKMYLAAPLKLVI